MEHKAEFEVKSWDEQPYEEPGNGIEKLTRATVKTLLHGEIEGEGEMEYLMTYRSDGTATFLGQERVVCTIGDRRGTFVAHHKGKYDGKKARSTFQIVPNSGTGELTGIKGKGKFVAPPGSTGKLEFDYEFEPEDDDTAPTRAVSASATDNAASRERTS